MWQNDRKIICVKSPNFNFEYLGHFCINFHNICAHKNCFSKLNIKPILGILLLTCLLIAAYLNLASWGCFGILKISSLRWCILG